MKYIVKRYYRESCGLHNSEFIKDLRIFGRNLKEVIIVDNLPASYKLQKMNGLPIRAFMGGKTDHILADLTFILEFLSQVEDVRTYISKFVLNDIILYEKANLIIKNEFEMQNSVGINQQKLETNKTNVKLNTPEKNCYNNDEMIIENNFELLGINTSRTKNEKYLRNICTFKDQDSKQKRSQTPCIIIEDNNDSHLTNQMIDDPLKKVLSKGSIQENGNKFLLLKKIKKAYVPSKFKTINNEKEESNGSDEADKGKIPEFENKLNPFYMANNQSIREIM